VALVRTKNEERNIERFCFSYSLADAVLVADGGSTDNTIEIANSFHNVKVKHYKEKLIRNELWRNPHGKHINFYLIGLKKKKQTGLFSMIVIVYLIFTGEKELERV